MSDSAPPAIPSPPPGGDAHSEPLLPAGSATPERPSSNWPARVPITPMTAVRKIRKRRGPWFGVAIVLGILIGIPVLLYVGLVLYVRLGFLDQAVREAIEHALGRGTTIDSVRVGGLETLRAEGLKVPSAHGQDTPAITAEALVLSWSPWSLALDKRLRSLTLDKPVLNFRRDAGGEWNFAWPQGRAGAYKLEQAVVRDGQLTIEWEPGRKLVLSHVEMTVSRPDPPLPTPITLGAELPSGSKLSANLLLGPGSSLAGRASGALDLESDLREVLAAGPGLQGRLTFDLSARQASAPASGSSTPSSAGALEVDGSLGLQDLRWELAPGLALAVPSREASLRGRIPASNGGGFALEDLRVRMDGLGNCAGRLEVPQENAAPAGSCLRLYEARASLNLDGLRALFVPRPLPQALSAHGELEWEDLDLTLPCAWDLARFRMSGLLKTHGTRLAWDGLGELPPLDLQGRVECAAGELKAGAVSLSAGAAGRAACSGFAYKLDGTAGWLEFLQKVRLDELALDLGRLSESAWGRRIVLGFAERSAPAPKDEPPLQVRGTLSATNLRVQSREEQGKQVLNLEGLVVKDLQFLRWPLSFRLPAGVFSGTLGAEASFVQDRLSTAVLSGDIGVSTSPLKARVELHAEPGADRKFAFRRLRLPAVTLPLAEFARIAGLQDLYALAWKGQLTLSAGEYNLDSGQASCALQLEAGSSSMRIAGVSGLSGRARLTFKDRRWSLDGRLEPSHYSALGWAGTLPAADFGFAVGQETPAAPWDVRLYVTLAGGEKLALQSLLEKTAKDAFKVRGSLELPWARSLTLQYDFLVDSAKQTAGPFFLNTAGLDLGALHEDRLGAWLLQCLAKPETWAMGGHFAPLKLELGGLGKPNDPDPTPLRWSELLNQTAWRQGLLTGTLQDVRLAHLPTRSEAEHLTGTFRANFSVDETSAWKVRLFSTLSQYEALVGDALYLPPLPGRNASLACDLQARTSADGKQVIRLDKFSCELEGAEAPLARLQISGQLQSSAQGQAAGRDEGLLRVTVLLPDLAAAQRELGIPNLRTRYPALAAMRISGGCLYEGQHLWSPESGALSGTLHLQKVNLSLGGARKLAARDLNGPLPLSFYRGLWPAEWKREQQGTVTVSGLEFLPLQVRQQPLAFQATPNGVRLANELVVELPGGQASLSELRMEDLLAREPALRFNLDVREVRVADLAQAEGWAVGGLQGTVVKGRLTNCALLHKAGPLGTWTLATEGELGAPCYQGQLRMGGFQARGLFGSSPVWGGWMKIERMSLLQFTGQNRQLGSMKALAGIALTDFTSTGLAMEDVQTFRLEVNTARRPDVEDYYDGKLALLLAPEMVHAAARQYGLSLEDVARRKFGIQQVGLALELQKGQLRGPSSTLGGPMVKGKGLTSPDIPASPETYTPWSECISRLRAHKAQVSKLPGE